MEDKEEEEANLSLPEDASDVEPSEDVNTELTEEQKGELSEQKEALAAVVCRTLTFFFAYLWHSY